MPRFEAERVREARRFFRTHEDDHVQELDAYGGSWYAYAEGYREAAEALAHRASERKAGSFLVFPIVYLYRHYVELMLKMLIIDLDRLHGADEPSPVGHDLEQLWRQLHRRLISVPGYRSGFAEGLAVIERAVREFAEYDTSAQRFRYPTDRQGAPVRHGMSAIDVDCLREEMGNLGLAFRQIEAAVDAWLDDMAQEFRVWELSEGDFR